MNLIEANEHWYKFEPIQGVLFAYNDSVQIKAGEFSGNNAIIISLVSLEPITYLVELGSSAGGDIVIAESELEKVD